MSARTDVPAAPGGAPGATAMGRIAVTSHRPRMMTERSLSEIAK